MQGTGYGVPFTIAMQPPPPRAVVRPVRPVPSHEEYYSPANEFNRRRAEYYDSGGLERAVARDRAAEAAEKRKSDNKKRTKVTVIDQRSTRTRKRDRPDDDNREQPEQQHVYNRQRTG